MLAAFGIKHESLWTPAPAQFVQKAVKTRVTDLMLTKQTQQ